MPMRRLLPLLLFTFTHPVFAGEAETLAVPAHRITADDPAWQDLTGRLRRQPEVTADFIENRWFAFKRTPTILRGEARVSTAHGLSLHYVSPQEQTVIIDAGGILLRAPTGDSVPPADPRAEAANSALLHVLQFDLTPLANAFDLYGVRSGATWKLALVPKEESLRRTLGQISIEGEGEAVRRIELRRSALQRVEILIAPPSAAAAFTAGELRRFFR